MIERVVQLESNVHKPSISNIKETLSRWPTLLWRGVYKGKSKLAVLMGDEFFPKIAGKVVIDFGCGDGNDAVEMAGRGAKRVIGIDIREDVLQAARQNAVAKGVQETCLFACSTKELADIVVSVDAFEHFGDPAGILSIMKPSPAADRRGARLLWANLVSPVGRSSVFCFSMGSSDLQ